MLTVSEAIVRSALQRNESRGSQWRLDHPEKDAQEATRNYDCRDGGGGAMEVAAVANEPLPRERLELLPRSRFFDAAALGPRYAEFAGALRAAESATGEEVRS